MWPFVREYDGIDLTSNATFKVRATSGFDAFIEEISCIVTEADSVITQPIISVGTDGDPTKYLDASTFTELNATLRRQSFSVFKTNRGETHFLVTIVGGEVSEGGVYRGNLFLKGIEIG